MFFSFFYGSFCYTNLYENRVLEREKLMRLTDRDKEVLEWINGFGFVKARDVLSKFFDSRTPCYRRMKAMTDNGFLRTKGVFQEENSNIYIPTKKALMATGDELPVVENLAVHTYKHDLSLVELSLMLEEKTGGEFIPERRLRQNPESYEVHNHIPDGLLITKDERISIELELSRKNKQRINRIMRDHSMNIEINEVWYFVKDDLLKSFILSEAKRAKFSDIKVFSI